MQPNWWEIREALQHVTITRRDGSVMKIDMIKDPGKGLRWLVLEVAHGVGRLLPAPVRQYLAAVPGKVAARAKRYQVRHRLRMLGRFRDELDRQRAQLDEVKAAIARVQARLDDGSVPLGVPWYASASTMSGELLGPRDLLEMRLAELMKQRDGLQAAIRENRQLEKAIIESLTAFGSVVDAATADAWAAVLEDRFGAGGPVPAGGSGGRVPVGAHRDTGVVPVPPACTAREETVDHSTGCSAPDATGTP